MIEKNHSQRNIYLHDLKNKLPNQQSNTVINRTGVRAGLAFLVVAACSAVIMHLNNNRTENDASTTTLPSGTGLTNVTAAGSADRASGYDGIIRMQANDGIAIDDLESAWDQQIGNQILSDLGTQYQTGPQRDLIKITSDPVTSESIIDERYYPRQPEYNWFTVEIKKGDSLSGIFNRLGLPPAEAVSLASRENMKSLNFLNVGNKLFIKKSTKNDFAGLKYRINRIKTLEVDRQPSGEIVSAIKELQPKTRIRDVTAPIEGNLFTTADNLNIPNRIISKLSNIFRWDIDFARDIKQGDRFSLIFEEQYIDDELIISGDILAAEFIINGKITRAIRHLDQSGNAHYYTPQGKSLRKAFMRNPIKFAKVTSGFSKRRYHPLLKKWRAHKGVDYGAPKGTPIMATADGVISHIGRKGAYGKAIVINHGKSYSSLYGHMKGYGKGLKNGSRVQQGQIIGYVGSTGLATGPHLHYEFRIDGRHVDPLAIDLPKSLPIDSEELGEFIAASEKWIRRLDALQGQSIAKVETETRPSI